MEFTEKHIAAGTMSYPPIDAEDFASQRHTSVYVCASAECQEAAAEYIQAVQGHRGVFVPFEAKRPSDPFAGIDSAHDEDGYDATRPAVS